MRWLTHVIAHSCCTLLQGKLTAVVDGAATVALPADNLVNEPAQAFVLNSKNTGKLSEEQIKEVSVKMLMRQRCDKLLYQS